MNREQWLAARREIITASDVAAILGYDDRRTALDVYVNKITGQEIEDSDAMLLGRCLEDGIGRAYAVKTGRPVSEFPEYYMAVHPEIPWLAATPDRETERPTPVRVDDSVVKMSIGESGPLEIKHAGWMKRRDWEDSAPLFVQIQLQIQIACMSTSWGAYCGVVGGSEIHYDDMDFNKAFFDNAVEQLDEFHWRLKHKRPPAVDCPKHLKAIKALYPNDNGETVDLSPEIELLDAQREEAKRTAKESDAQADELEAKIREAIGSATFGKLPSGVILSLKTTPRKGYTTVVKPTTYRTLRRISK
jgi:putative phage-type endonuclease